MKVSKGQRTVDNGQRQGLRTVGPWTRAGAFVLCLLSFVHVAQAANQTTTETLTSTETQTLTAPGNVSSNYRNNWSVSGGNASVATVTLASTTYTRQPSVTVTPIANGTGTWTVGNGSDSYTWTINLTVALPEPGVLDVSTIRINEVQSSNDATCPDEFKESPDWLELYNAGDDRVELGGCFLTDKPAKPEKWWRIPQGTVIAPKGFLRVFADGTGRPGTYLHTTFSISAGGDTLAFIDRSSNTVDAVEFGAIPCDRSYGRKPDGSGSFTYFATPTPGKANANESYLAPLGPVVFSVPRGICTEAFDLTLSHPSNGVRIVYTLDHSEPTETHGTEYTAGTAIRISRTTNVRAAAFLAGHVPYRNVTTHTYVFLDEVAEQGKSAESYPDDWYDAAENASGWTTVDQKTVPASYGPSATILAGDAAKAELVRALKAAPIVSVTMSDEDMFGATDGIYTHPCALEDKDNAMRQADIEWVTGDNVLGLGAGLAVHGGHSRYFTFTAKKSFTVKFRGRYGASSLEAPVMKDAGSEVDAFKTLILRAEANHHWTAMDSDHSSRYPQLGTSMHDQFIRDTQKLMSGYQAEGTHVHLFLNGMYWGLYNLTDQVSDDFAAATWGGDAEDYNVMNRDGAKDGSNTVYNAALTQAGKGIATQANYEDLTDVFDLDAYIDYVILETFIANEDWAANNNNWVCCWSDVRNVPIRYVVWDADMSIREDDRNELTQTGGPMQFHSKLKGSAEYKLRFADRIHRFFYNDGLLTPTSISNRYAKLAARVRPMVFAESARWGAYQYDNWDEINHYSADPTPKAKYDMAAWDKEYTRLTATWFPKRCETYLGYVANAGLYPTLKAAEFKVTDRTAALRESPANGVTVYYTTDGSDPRVAFKTGDSSISSGAKTCAFGTEIAVGDEACVLKARAYQSGTWSALSEVEFKRALGPMNRFIPTGNGENWDDDANWDWGYAPNGPGETASIEPPTEVKSDKKNWRNIHINSNDVTVGFVEVANGGWTNRIDTGDFGGNLIFDGGTNETGKAVDAMFTVTDAAGPGLTMIDLDAPNVVRLDTDIAFDVGNAEGSPDSGGLLLKGTWDCGGHNLKKTGAGRMTIAFRTVAPIVADPSGAFGVGYASATDAGAVAEAATVRGSIGKLQCEGGITAVETPIQVESITKSGVLWVQMGGTNLEEAVESAVASADTVKPSVCLFAPTDGRAETNEVWYGGVVAAAIESADVSVYVPAKSGAIGFCGRRWKACPDATWALATNDDGRVTFQATIPPPPPVRVRINEIQSSNDQTIKDERGEDSDWVELYNAGDEAVDLSGWGLSDKKSKPYKWTFPSGTVLAPGAYLLVFCDEGESGTYLHASFSLSGSGETLTLTDTDGRTIDQVEFGEIPCDTSYGRTASGDGGEYPPAQQPEGDASRGAAYAFFSPATPGAANAETGFAPPPGPVLFSKERGLYEEPFAVTLSNADAAAEIWYTTDHSDPSPTNKTAKPYKGEAISIAGTTILRATAVKAGCVPCRNIQSHTYIFPEQVANQVKPSCAGDIWTDDHWCSYCNKTVTGNAAGCPASYGISKTILEDPKVPDAKERFVAALRTGTVLSITMSDTEMFDPDTGLHSHPNTLDIDRAASIEWVTGNHVFGTDCGVAMQGGWARHFEITPKKSFRLKFRGRFGASKLEVPVMDDVGCGQAEFKDLILRGENNQSWGRYSKKGTSMADQVLRDLQGEMSGYQSHGTHVHLYINGLYWGVYNLCERGDANFASTATGWGGNESDWDVLKHDDGDAEDQGDGVLGLAVRDGTMDDFTALVKYVQSKATGTSMSLADFEDISTKVDIDAFIDYYILECYIGNNDWPENNWIAMMSTKLGQPLRYLGWDLEYALHDKTMNRLTTSVTKYSYTADKIQNALLKSSEYKLRFADRVHRHFFNGGVLMADALQARYSARADLIRRMIFAESARWGAYYPDHLKVNGTSWSFGVHYQDINDSYKTVFTVDIWEAEYSRILGFFRDRWGNFKTYLKNAGLWTDAQAATAEFKKVEGEDLSVTLEAPSGSTIYYTTDGSDPRSDAAKTCESGQTITVTDTTTLKARACNNTSKAWSALSEIELVNPIPPTNEFIPTGNGEDWEVDANWTRGYYPNAAGETAEIGVPTEVKSATKTWRNVKIGVDVTAGAVEVTNGGWTNRLTGAGSLTLFGEISEDGSTTNDATFVVTDEAGAGLTMIDLDAPGVIRLGSDATFAVSNAVGSAEYGGLLVKGTIDGNGHNLKKTGPGRLTLACTNAAPSEIGKLQCEEGILAVETPITVGEITKKDGILWVKAGEAEAGDALRSALVSRSSYNDKLTIGLFVPTEFGSETRKWYGGLVAGNLATKKATVYVRNATGDVAFAGEKWSACPDAEVKTAEVVLDDGVTSSTTYQVRVPYFGPLVEVTAKTEGRGAVEGAGPLVPGTDAVLTAVPETGWTFMDWTVGGTNATENPLTLANVTNDCEVTARFSSNGGTVGGVDCATVEEAVRVAIRTGQPIVFPVKPTVDRAAHTISAPEGGTATVSWWNDIVVSDDGLTVSFELTESVRNPPPQPVTRMTWRKGVKERVRLGGAREDGDGNVIVSVKTIKGLSYALGQDGEAKSGWTPGNGGIRDLTAPKPASGEYEVLVKDSEQE